jgi:PA14 domain-containing protein
MMILTATNPRVGIPYENPARDLLAPDYLRARFAQNTDGLFEGERDLVKQSAAFNCGQLAGVPPQYQLWPLLGWWLLAGTMLLSSTTQRSTSVETPPTDVKIANQKRRRTLIVKTSALAAFLIAIGLPPVLHHATVAARNPKQGLRGRYFRNVNWEEPAVEEAVDAEVNFDWTRTLPLPPPFSIDWTGQITIEQTGRYEFALIADDGALLEIDGRVVVDVSHGAILQKKTGSVELSSGTHSIRVHYFNALFGGLIKLWWTPPGRPEEIVPREVLVPSPAAVGRSPAD